MTFEYIILKTYTNIYIAANRHSTLPLDMTIFTPFQVTTGVGKFDPDG
jgi:hypothetical protein